MIIAQTFMYLKANPNPIDFVVRVTKHATNEVVMREADRMSPCYWNHLLVLRNFIRIRSLCKYKHNLALWIQDVCVLYKDNFYWKMYNKKVYINCILTFLLVIR